MAWTLIFSDEFKDILHKFAKAGNGLHQPKNLNFTFSQRTVWRKLRHWGLIDSPQKGYGQITQRGLEFLEGQLLIPRELQIEDDTVVNKSKELIRY
jgi:hypothetical protein